MTDERDGETTPDDSATEDHPKASRERERAGGAPSVEGADDAGELTTSDADAETDADAESPEDGQGEADAKGFDRKAESELTSDSTTKTGPKTEPGSAPKTGPKAEPGSAPKAANRSRGRLVTAVSVGGELLITAGVVLALFVLYSLWWTNVIANREADREAGKVRDSWAADRDLGDDSPSGPGDLDTKDGIGFLHAPGLGKKEILVKPGTNPKDLNQGIAGYYEKPVKSAMPWDKKGNFSLAAHRDGHGAKFHNIHKLKDGDPLVFETKDTWYVYKVYSTLPETSKYNVDVLDDVPKESGAKKKGRYITLTTCTPVYTSNYRYIVWGELVRTEKVDADRTLPSEVSDD